MRTERHQTNIHIEGDHEVEVRVSESDGHWYRLFRAVNQHGLLTQLSGPAVKVLLVLAEHVNDQIRDATGEWLAWPSCRRIGEQTGLSERAVRYALRSLERHKVLKRLVNGSGDHTAKYQIVAPPRHDGAPRHRGAPRHECVDTPAQRCPLKRKKKEIEQQQRRNGAERSGAHGATGAAPDSAAAELLDALTRAGISEPTRSSLAKLPNLTARMVQKIADRARERGKGPGAVVLDLRAASEKAGRDAETKRQRREQSRAEQVAIETRRQQEATEALGGEDRQQALDAGWRALGRSRMT